MIDEKCHWSDALLAIENEITRRELKGTVSNSIPELARIDIDHFGMSVCLRNGHQICVGDTSIRFSVQSISKVFSLAVALGRYGDNLWCRVGRDPTFGKFNSAQELETRAGTPANPFVNAGAIVVTDMILANSTPAETIGEVLQFVRLAASDEDILIDPEVANSEMLSAHKNWALAHILTDSGNLHHPCELTLGTYFHNCAISMTCEQLARFGRFLAGLETSKIVTQPPEIRPLRC